jgi:hypothetical protein
VFTDAMTEPGTTAGAAQRLAPGDDYCRRRCEVPRTPGAGRTILVALFAVALGVVAMGTPAGAGTVRSADVVACTGTVPSQVVLSTASMGKSFCVSEGGLVTVRLVAPVGAPRWTPVRIETVAGIQGVLVPIGTGTVHGRVTSALFRARRSGRAELFSSRRACAVVPDRPTCFAILGWRGEVTVHAPKA